MEDEFYDLKSLPNDKYKKFFETSREIDLKPIKDWKANHLIFYFCRKYYDEYKVRYQFKFNTPSPVKSFEVFRIKQLCNRLTSDPVLLKEYIDWVFATKVINAKRKLTSISFLTTEAYMNEYKFNVLLNQNNNESIDRTTTLPAKYKTIFSLVGYPISTYGDLAFLNKMSDKPSKLNSAFSNAEALGLNLDLLEHVV